jgi:hypothetical protein
MAKGTTLFDFQGSWDPEDLKELWASLAPMDFQALSAYQDQLGHLGIGGFQEKSWVLSLDLGEMLDCLDTLG